MGLTFGRPYGTCSLYTATQDGSLPTASVRISVSRAAVLGYFRISLREKEKIQKLARPAKEAGRKKAAGAPFDMNNSGCLRSSWY
jgi:hypothetical protein